MLQLHHGDCLDVMANMPSKSIDLVVTDPPYFQVKGDDWDNQWASADDFIVWMKTVIGELDRLLKDNGSIYLFTSSKMASRVESSIAKHFRVLSSMVWVKPDAAGAEKGAKGRTIRSYVPQTERIIFAGRDNPLGEALREAMQKADISAATLNRLAFGRTTGIIYLWLCSRENKGSCEPSEADWLRAMSVCGVDVSSEDYNRLRRPFNVSEHYSDVWTYAPVRRHRKHPCEKPTEMIKHMIINSSNANATVFDPFMGSGTTGVAAVNTERSFIGIERDYKYFHIATDRINSALDEWLLRA